MDKETKKGIISNGRKRKRKRGGKQKGEAEAAVGLMADYKNVNVAISESWM